MPQSGKLPVLFLLTGQNQHFRPAGATRCIDSREIWHSRGARRSAWSYAIRANRFMRGGQHPKSWQFLLFGNRGEPFDRFL